MKRDTRQKSSMASDLPRVQVTPIVRVVGPSGWQLYARPDCPQDCCVLERFGDVRVLFGREDIDVLIPMLAKFKIALDETYGTLDKYRKARAGL